MQHTDASPRSPLARTIGLTAFVLLLGIALSLVSVMYQRPAAELAQYGTECSIDQWQHCWAPVTSGGFPFAFLFDSTATSVLYQLGVEDEFRWWPFAMNVWIYALLCAVTLRIMRR